VAGIEYSQEGDVGEFRGPEDRATSRGLAGLVKLPRRIDSPYVFTNEQGNRYKDIKKGFGTACR
jgi:hypothetical protein